jgi:hypothetical protein
VRPEAFRRVCTSFDAWVVALGLSRLLNELQLVEGPAAYLILIGVGLLDSWMLSRCFAQPVSVRSGKSGPL